MKKVSMTDKYESLPKSEEIIWDEVQLKLLPKMADLQNEVAAYIDKNCTWWDKHGMEWVDTGVCCVLVYISLLLMAQTSPLYFCTGLFINGACFQMLAVRMSHAAFHGTLCQSEKWNKFWGYIFGDICGSFSYDVGYEWHIRGHHPHTNIVGLGDSSTWKVPFLPAYIYMYCAPLLVPLITIPVYMTELIGKWMKMLRYVFLCSLGLYINIWLLINIAGITTLTRAVSCLLTSRAVLVIPYIHISIFQHIGLPMYSREKRPVRIYQMTTGVLNLPRNILMDWCFGYSIYSCHIEHHLFPKMSDNMCKQIQPIVSRFVKASGLPYNYDTYLSRMWVFTKQYNTLMVNAPPVTHFVGIQ